MRWRGEDESSNIEDRRGGISGRHIGIGGVVLGLVALYFTKDPTLLLQSLVGDNGSVAPTTSSQPYKESTAEADNRHLVQVVLHDTETAWDTIFAQNGKQYEHPTVVLFNNVVESACGQAESAMGPFYCPGDRKVYIDLSFFDELQQRFGAPGEFARAYVIAHEVGHHVQNLLGLSAKVQRLQETSDQVKANALSVRLELQADCYAGVWAHYTDQSRHFLESGDIEAGLNAASAIGDDRLQQQARGRVVPDSFTHGSSAQRVRWFKRGIDSGDVKQCNTFKAGEL
jgi:predicted metalloprotease